jgi:hypothetical protein
MVIVISDTPTPVHICWVCLQPKVATCADTDPMGTGEQRFECCAGSVYNPNNAAMPPSQANCCLVSNEAISVFVKGLREHACCS